MMMLLALALQAAAPPPIPPGCDSPESHQWDFWVGSWEVRPKGANQVIAHSLIEKRYTGCAIRENWMPIGKEVNGGGGSLSFFDPKLKQWRQVWIDSSGTRVDLDGGFKDGVMVGRDFHLDAELAARLERIAGEGAVTLSVQEPPRLALVG